MRVRHVSFVAALCLPILTAPLKAADGPKLTGGYQYTPGLDRTVLLLSRTSAHTRGRYRCSWNSSRSPRRSAAPTLQSPATHWRRLWL